MSDLSKSVEGYRTYGNFYDDKKMKSDYDDYTSKIKDCLLYTSSGTDGYR